MTGYELIGLHLAVERARTDHQRWREEWDRVRWDPILEPGARHVRDLTFDAFVAAYAAVVAALEAFNGPVITPGESGPVVFTLVRAYDSDGRPEPVEYAFAKASAI